MQASARLSSSAASKKVIAGASSAITRSCYRTSRGKAHAAPLSAQEPPPKGQKRITKQERRVRIVEFVDKFRASNDGKFPSVTNVRQQVGGSHYTVREVLQELEYNHTKLPLGNAKAAPLQQTVEVAEHSRPKEDIVKNPSNCDSSKSSEKIQDVDDVLISQKDAATSTGIVEKNKFSVSLGVEAISDPGNQQRETEANRLAMKSAEKFVNASELIASDQSGNDKLIDANIHGREHKPKHTPEDSTSSGLFGSLKSFAYGIRSFWKKL